MTYLSTWNLCTKTHWKIEDVKRCHLETWNVQEMSAIICLCKHLLPLLPREINYDSFVEKKEDLKILEDCNVNNHKPSSPCCLRTVGRLSSRSQPPLCSSVCCGVRAWIFSSRRWGGPLRSLGRNVGGVRISGSSGSLSQAVVIRFFGSFQKLDDIPKSGEKQWMLESAWAWNEWRGVVVVSYEMIGCLSELNQ